MVEALDRENEETEQADEGEEYETLPFGMGYNDRGLIVGMTGTGKTTLARVLCADKFHLVVCDPKHRFSSAQDFLIAENLREVQSASGDRRVREEGFAIIYRPSIADCTRENINPFYQWIFERENTFLYNDELSLIIENPMVYPQMLKAIHAQGRERNIGVLECTQRPSGLPGFIYSETDYWYKFPLTYPPDLERMADFMGKNIREPADYPLSSVHQSKHTFYFWQTGERMLATPYELDLT